jgi:hypothetical protein
MCGGGDDSYSHHLRTAVFELHCRWFVAIFIYIHIVHVLFVNNLPQQSVTVNINIFMYILELKRNV